MSILKRRKTLLWLFANYVFVCHKGLMYLRVIDVVVQAYGRKTNLIPLVLEETLLGLDKFFLSHEHFPQGSPLLIQMWAHEHFHVVAPVYNEFYTPATYGQRSLGVEQKVEQEWLFSLLLVSLTTLYGCCPIGESRNLPSMPPVGIMSFLSLPFRLLLC